MIFILDVVHFFSVGGSDSEHDGKASKHKESKRKLDRAEVKRKVCASIDKGPNGGKNSLSLSSTVLGLVACMAPTSHLGRC